jgi:Ca-activated chloride channel family protein
LDQAKENTMFELANPRVLFLCLAPLLLWLLIPKAKVKLPIALNVPFFSAVMNLVNQKKNSFRSFSLILPTLIWLLLVFALAGPRYMGAPKPLEREGYNIMMALDLSGSMEIPDMILQGQPASRLMVVKRAATQFVRDRNRDKIGLILFGSRAYLQTPLTYDRKTVLLRLEDATVGLAGKTTSIGDAIGLAVKRLSSVPKKGRILILLTDGANNSGVLEPIKAAELAQDEGIKIYTIGLGSASDVNALTNSFLMQSAFADLDEETLEKLATMTGGRYFRATDTETLSSIYKTINQLETIKQEQATVRPQIDYYPWFVGLALLLCFYWLLGKTKLAQKANILLPNQKALNS